MKKIFLSPSKINEKFITYGCKKVNAFFVKHFYLVFLRSISAVMWIVKVYRNSRAYHFCT